MTTIIDAAAAGAADEAPDIALLRPVGPLDFHTYAAFVEDARRVYESGSRCLRIDLTEVPAIGLAGLVALYEVAELFDGRPVPDFSRGWVDVHPTLGPGAHDGSRAVEVIGLYGDAARALERAGLVTRFRMAWPAPRSRSAIGPAAEVPPGSDSTPEARPLGRPQTEAL